MNKTLASKWLYLGVAALLMALAGCKSMKAPATASVAVSDAAVDSASTAGAAAYAPLEMNSAREKLERARQALRERDYKLANALATQAEADARLAQSKADSAKAQAASGTLQEDIRVLREELQRNSAPPATVVQPAPPPVFPVQR